MSPETKWRRSRKELLRDYSLYVLISVVPLGAAIWAAKANISEEAIHTWGSVLFETPLIFTFVAIEYRKLLQTRTFWIASAVLLTLHFALFAIIFANVSEWRPAWTAYILGAEALILLTSGDWLWHWFKLRYEVLRSMKSDRS